MYERASYMMCEAVAGFDWDDGNREKCQKHGVSITKVEGLFARPHALRVDVERSMAGKRLKAIGRTASGRLIFVAFTLRDREAMTYIRPISARYMYRREIEHYEEENPGLSE
jgi:uncharacterized DUF497 family protein